MHLASLDLAVACLLRHDRGLPPPRPTFLLPNGHRLPPPPFLSFDALPFHLHLLLLAWIGLRNTGMSSTAAQLNRLYCLVCDTEQSVAQVCSNCGVCMEEFFCRACKFFDDDVDKEQYHCKDCGICRVGAKDKFFHCHKCRHSHWVGIGSSCRLHPAVTVDCSASSP